jgi:uncharacterized hydrophobic protein (TIGR00271 family)
MRILELAKNVYHYLNLEPELEQDDVVFQEINRSVVFRGTNLWILMFAIIVASVGLNMNSTAVIIGAMLISPLMGPINGMGYSIATYDIELFKKSVKNFTFAISASLVASTFYFILSPVSTAHSELLARTSPTIYDVVIALFGGLAGIVAIASKQKGNVIPGVAIATALMPPLCTAGYGLATFQLDFLFGALYLFTINTIFIAIASVWISQILKFPIRSVVDPIKRKRINQTITAVITVVLLPSIYFGYKLVLNEKFTGNAQNFIDTVTRYEGNYLLNYKIDASKRFIQLDYLGESLTVSQKTDLKKIARRLVNDGVVLEINQGVDLNALDQDRSEIFSLRDQIRAYRDEIQEKKREIRDLKNYGLQGKKLLMEINALHPEIENLAFSAGMLHQLDSADVQNITSVTLFLSHELTANDKTSIQKWLEKRLETEALLVNFRKQD